MNNIDERLEALTHSLELLASMHKDTEKTVLALAHEGERISNDLRELGYRQEQISNDLRELGYRQERISKDIKELGYRHGRLEELVLQVAEGTARLLRVVEVHEERIRGLEKKDS